MKETATGSCDFRLESDLLDFFVATLEGQSSPWRTASLLREFNYANGRADVVAVDDSGSIIAFEGKLSKWRKALHQAYRNLCFANRSYVVLPKETALRASRFEVEFQKRGVGLCYVDARAPVVLVEAECNEPILPWLSRKALLGLYENDRQCL